MARAYMDAPIDQSITPEMQQAIEPMLIDLIENYGVTEFCLWVQDMVRKVEPVLVKLKKRYPFIKILNIRTHDVSEFDSDDLNDWLEVNSIKGWQEANCQIRMIMYLCTMCHLYKKDLKCERRDIVEGKISIPHQMVKLADYMPTDNA